MINWYPEPCGHPVKPWHSCAIFSDRNWTALVRKTPKQSVEIIKRFAEEGNIFAANIYGDMLMEGVWDIKRMQVDLVRGNLQAASPNGIDDPYLLVARDPIKAVEFYRTAAYSEMTANQDNWHVPN